MEGLRKKLTDKQIYSHYQVGEAGRGKGINGDEKRHDLGSEHD